MELYKYQGAGNDFLIADNRDGSVCLEKDTVMQLCDRHYGLGADGMMLLDRSDIYDFRMVYFNSDGSGGMMCGNGGRCIVAFAADMGMTSFRFEAADGPHEASVTESSGNRKTVRLKMKNITEIRQENQDSWFIDTGTRHAVRFVSGLDTCDVSGKGREIRYSSLYAPAGANANFAEFHGNSIHVRTYEKGVEAETFACGTGITASAAAAYMTAPERFSMDSDGRVRIEVQALRDRLSVDFIPSMYCDGTSGEKSWRFDDVWLTGPAVRVAKIIVL